MGDLEQVARRYGDMNTNSEIRAAAGKSFKHAWRRLIAVMVLALVLQTAGSVLISLLKKPIYTEMMLSIFLEVLCVPLTYGVTMFFLHALAGEKPKYGLMLRLFRPGRTLFKTYLLGAGIVILESLPYAALLCMVLFLLLDFYLGILAMLVITALSIFLSLRLALCEPIFILHPQWRISKIFGEAWRASKSTVWRQIGFMLTIGWPYALFRVVFSRSLLPWMQDVLGQTPFSQVLLTSAFGLLWVPYMAYYRTALTGLHLSLIAKVVEPKPPEN